MQQHFAWCNVDIMKYNFVFNYLDETKFRLQYILQLHLNSLSVAEASKNKQENLPLNPFLSLLRGTTRVVLASVTCGHLETVILPQDTAV